MVNRLSKKNREKGTIILKDVLIVAASIVFAIVIGKTGIIHSVVGAIDSSPVIAIFIAGIFFTSMFTIAPASVALAEIAQTTSVGTVIIWGALGAVIGDLIIFLFIRDGVASDIKTVLKGKYFKKLVRLSHFGFMRWLGPVTGALIIASPLPDELGLAMMGMSRVKTPIFIPVVFVMNMLGIYLVAALGRGI
jgi:hypothetical protein